MQRYPGDCQLLDVESKGSRPSRWKAPQPSLGNVNYCTWKQPADGIYTVAVLSATQPFRDSAIPLVRQLLYWEAGRSNDPRPCPPPPSGLAGVVI
ncbi:uncharacterized protein CANTADRAFT_146060 [Suhomyces tanzawaensis NRRL Y-17324]|uniref:Uncharacterized protein n=1 Tax=Suhomyces tanzawaensis NRRL Y-17324 TaxID=984487 RepID=A0A1E4SSE0_9ASCO|nr:uncharacterized protein CANTADRAFT_146060 [Suhomyces tanzawaensis NRRL Y-17324]ODV82433.1 hypothetical protein CANTADRAFT_146060 [Suhomyces tanzawaensis NRRL Y-17324]